MKNTISSFRLRLEQLFLRFGIGMRAKLIGLFVLIKVLPLVLLAFLAWNQSWRLGEEVRGRTEEIADKADTALAEAGRIAVSDAKQALDERATEDIERMSTDTASDVADFLYGRDDDILQVASLEPTEKNYREYVQRRTRRIVSQGEWQLDPDEKSWIPANRPAPLPLIASSIEENDHRFNYRSPERFAFELRPLFLEMTFIAPDGKERIKVTTSALMDPALKDVSRRENTFIKAETYFPELQKLRPGEIYVSDVIGEYVRSRVIGKFTPANAAKFGVEFVPELSAYAGKENPLGKRFKGLVRWATPVEKNGQIIGYVTLALDHDHIMEFTSHLMPTSDRYTEIPDASGGNYAFIWDHKGRSIVHPRHFSIAGYDAATGDPQIPWLEDRIYDEWQASGQSYADFIQDVPTFVEQSNSKKPADALTKQGLVGLDCRYLNFAPQCTGWFDLTREGGSGSFLILWSGLWKLNTAATIPYYTGQYGKSPRGFGFVAIGAGLEDFHGPANATEEVITSLIKDTDKSLRDIADQTFTAIGENLLETAYSLSISTGLMVVLVIFIAIWLASAFTRSITRLINGMARFRAGERHFRFNALIKDEMGALADSFDALAHTMDSSIQGSLAITALDRKILYMNQEALERIGKNLDDVLGTSYDENSMFPPGSLYNPLDGLLAHREAESMYHERSGKYFRGTASYLTNAESSPIGYIISTIDVTDFITEQKRIEEQRSLLDTIFSSSPDLIWYKDAEGRYKAVNPRFASITNRAPNELVGLAAEELFTSSIADDAHTKDNIAIENKYPLYTEEQFTFADGHTEILDAVRTPLFTSDGELKGILGVARDVSLRVAMEDELRTTQQELKTAVKAANKANESKSTFLARMSHEIRTPMNAIIGMTNIIKKKLASPSPCLPEVEGHLLQIEVSSTHLLGLLNDILDISKIEAGKIDLAEEVFDLNKLLSGVESIIRPRCQEKNIQFDVSVRDMEHSVFTSDPLRLRQVLINLLGNSAKFTPGCGHVRFTVTCLEREEGRERIAFAVVDNGIGVSQQARETLFMPFEQGSHKITQRYGGTGLGLSISRSIVQLMGGDIEVVSVEGEGSEFSFAIWLREAELHSEGVPQIGGEFSFRGKHALLVDDVEINRVIVIEQLADTGLVIDEAEDGLAALEQFSKSDPGHYDIIFMDVQMPNMDGYGAAKAIRGLDRPDAATVPIIAMTANAFKEDVEKAMAHGMNDHLAKPLEHDKFMETLFRFLGLSAVRYS